MHTSNDVQIIKYIKICTKAPRLIPPKKINKIEYLNAPYSKNTK